jgi:hypothetical protein
MQGFPERTPRVKATVGITTRQENLAVNDELPKTQCRQLRELKIPEGTCHRVPPTPTILDLPGT